MFSVAWVALVGDSVAVTSSVVVTITEARVAVVAIASTRVAVTSSVVVVAGRPVTGRARLSVRAVDWVSQTSGVVHVHALPQVGAVGGMVLGPPPRVGVVANRGVVDGPLPRLNIVARAAVLQTLGVTTTAAGK